MRSNGATSSRHSAAAAPFVSHLHRSLSTAAFEHFLPSGVDGSSEESREPPPPHRSSMDRADGLSEMQAEFHASPAPPRKSTRDRVKGGATDGDAEIEVILRDNLVGDVGATVFAQTIAQCRLRWIDLTGNALGDKGGAILAEWTRRSNSLVHVVSDTEACGVARSGPSALMLLHRLCGCALSVVFRVSMLVTARLGVAVLLPSSMPFTSRANRRTAGRARRCSCWTFEGTFSQARRITRYSKQTTDRVQTETAEQGMTASSLLVVASLVLLKTSSLSLWLSSIVSSPRSLSHLLLGGNSFPVQSFAPLLATILRLPSLVLLDCSDIEMHADSPLPAVICDTMRQQHHSTRLHTLSLANNRMAPANMVRGEQSRTHCHSSPRVLTRYSAVSSGRTAGALRACPRGERVHHVAGAEVREPTSSFVNRCYLSDRSSAVGFLGSLAVPAAITSTRTVRRRWALRWCTITR